MKSHWESINIYKQVQHDTSVYSLTRELCVPGVMLAAVSVLTKGAVQCGRKTPESTATALW